MSNAQVVAIGSEMPAALDVKEGDTVFVTHSDDNGLPFFAYDPNLLAALDATEVKRPVFRTVLWIGEGVPGFCSWSFSYRPLGEVYVVRCPLIKGGVRALRIVKANRGIDDLRLD